MKSHILESLILGLSIAFFGVCVYSGMEKSSNRGRVVHVRGLSEKEFPADRAFWRLGYTELGNDIPTLYADVAQKNAKIKDFLQKAGISADEITIEAPNLTDNEAVTYRESKARFRYSAETPITVATSKVDVIRILQSQIVNLATDGIAINFNYTTFEFTSLNTVKPQMIEEATHNAREAAEKFAKDSESKLGKIRTASQGVFSIENRDENTPYIKKIRVVTTVDFALED